MKRTLPVLCALIMVACGKKDKDLIVKGHVDGLKKGTIYLKKMNDSSLVSVDSVSINGSSDFELSSALESPQMFYLYLDKNSKQENRIAFFADKGITEINTSLKNFAFGAKIKGSKQQDVYAEYQKIISRLNGENLNLIEEQLNAQKSGDSALIDSLNTMGEKLLKRRYLYSVNFAINHADSEVAPYIALADIYNAQYKLLDTINKSLTPQVKASKYGKELDTFLAKIRANENIKE
ncbi:DUF4369 domain-containing protein [Gaetbulibacter aestuarii]|uniref:DUF4369 domain-containing protein n=2 Tax=Gaetbulibacter aestuarii TaxID=1502358 RepID=A0ABW7MYK9_9FLAO